MAGVDRIDGYNLGPDDYDGVSYEPSTGPKSEAKTMAQVRQEIAEEERAAAKANLHSRFDGPGVEVELSVESVKAAEAAPKKEQSIFEIFRDTWNSFIQIFKDFWNGTSDETAQADSVEIEEKADDAESIVAFMQNYGGKHLAKNSDLLTQYDRSGHIVSPNASDRRRILQGEGKVSRY